MTLTDAQLREKLEAEIVSLRRFNAALVAGEIEMESALAESRQREQRAVEALRLEVVVHDYTESTAWVDCRCCDGHGGPGDEPKHNTVTLSDGPGPCPAELRKEEP